jgi:nucleoid-associated protein YgaU
MFSRALRCFVVWLMATLSLTTLSWLALTTLQGARVALETGALTGQSFETLLLWLCSAVITACCGWLWTTTTMAVIAIGRGHVRGRVRGCPEFVRRGVLIACGVAIAGSLTLPVHAADGDGGSSVVGNSDLAGLPLPDRTSRHDSISTVEPSVSRAQRDEVTPIRVVDDHRPAERFVTVEAGDTLWDLASATLAEDATGVDVAERTQQLHHLNREVIGADPDRIYPGQELRVPGSEEE